MRTISKVIITAAALVLTAPTASADPIETGGGSQVVIPVNIPVTIPINLPITF
ncbi:DUF2147 domain-containing protein [Actinokineospora iranica]|uniref:Small secreted domain n=1 Tax=Actinokineospora iranica TaxID=1271860 RepID=A0A1G6TIC7_9PSEU|nr:hypothetical protein [Actinokineospora iranica]SDD28791.1 hypothetical protein SAMN05216174_109160 [Actinokineospora iranica]